jgi:hypothetical protein
MTGEGELVQQAQEVSVEQSHEPRVTQEEHGKTFVSGFPLSCGCRSRRRTMKATMRARSSDSSALVCGSGLPYHVDTVRRMLLVNYSCARKIAI